MVEAGFIGCSAWRKMAGALELRGVAKTFAYTETLSRGIRSRSSSSFTESGSSAWAQVIQARKMHIKRAVAIRISDRSALQSADKPGRTASPSPAHQLHKAA